MTKFAFQKSYNFLDRDDFAASFHQTIRDFSELSNWNRHFGIVVSVIESIPRWLVKFMNPAGVEVLDFFNVCGTSSSLDIGNLTNRMPRMQRLKLKQT